MRNTAEVKGKRLSYIFVINPSPAYKYVTLPRNTCDNSEARRPYSLRLARISSINSSAWTTRTSGSSSFTVSAMSFIPLLQA